MKTMIGVCLAMLFFCIVGLVSSIVSSVRHERELRENGCQKMVEAETGKSVYCGKACSRPEKVIVYECAGGQRRVEFK